MKLHEYQARDLLAANGVATTRGRVASTPAEARAIAQELGGKVVVKAQIHAGGRGKGRLVAQSETAAMYHNLTTDPDNYSGKVKGDRIGGVRLADTVDEAEAAASAILGKHLVSIQTGPEGKLVKNVLVAEQTDIAKEYYLAAIIDGMQGSPLIMASAEGGQEIEVVAHNNPEAIVRLPVSAAAGYDPYVGRTLAARLGLAGDHADQFGKIVQGLYKTLLATDASLVEINPLALTEDGRVVAVDAKLTVDDNALFRHKDLEALRDKDEEDPLEIKAQELGVANFIKLEGNIGCVVNGAGLAMATMDTIKLAGGQPANFLDIGTVNDPQRVVSALSVILDDPSVKAILVNIFGGMARVDIIAQGVIDAHRQMKIDVPVVMRLIGTNLAEGEKLVEESGLPLIRANGLAEAAQKAVAAAGAR
ncbi:MAG: ADP-forming succinate--CoA ligase subunit beta [Dehalococcoidia bacterium]|jgi:succinyl-CoA synthetase beta subunit|uniref:ADP-forming succinate--CoA ligase subunit beta n=1 Tax=Candidatus Amarobacter glycogenicus TaxID=3140699 RepID=UPI002A1156EC|nr:ADP-forming succinate--CoA ligase subunit beta [Dehalococcoidia bacterium]MBK9613130.1 ADP-forming succinate--CoA ligase subunit beta [Dehalococcoidia bacterium]MCC6269434.1 ADP-forming succinate--CoA ligase subunit beta [Dehalococcoidia bacterium]